MDRDIRTEQNRDAITQAWSIWNYRKPRLDTIRANFNYALTQSQTFAKGFGTKGE